MDTQVEMSKAVTDAKFDRNSGGSEPEIPGDSTLWTTKNFAKNSVKFPAKAPPVIAPAAARSPV